jgi:hypothetical protein
LFPLLIFFSFIDAEEKENGDHHQTEEEEYEYQTEDEEFAPGKSI